MPRVGFEPIMSLFGGAKIFRALDSAATVIGSVIRIRIYKTVLEQK
jgi:hypothetical protein